MPILSIHELIGLGVLRNVDLDSIRPRLEQCMVLSLGPDETLIRAGERNLTMFVVLEGRLAIDEGAALVGQVFPGETVGEVSLLDDRPASTTVRAAMPTRVLAIDEESFWAIARASHPFALNLLTLLADRVRRTSTQLGQEQREKKELELEASTDALTQLRNRRWVDGALPRAICRAREFDEPLSVVAIDVDFFKRINDELGHPVGDRVLRGIAECLQGAVRARNVVARTGGEEFLVVLPGTGIEGARMVAERLRVNVALLELPDVDRPLSVSAGVACLCPEDDAESIVAHADAALYQAKRGGRNRVVLWRQDPT